MEASGNGLGLFLGGFRSGLGLLTLRRRGGLLGKQYRVDVRQNTSTGNGDSLEKLSQLLVISDREKQVPRVDPRLLVVPRRVSSQFKDLRFEYTTNDGLGIVGRKFRDSED